jgi:hypothetical protein
LLSVRRRWRLLVVSTAIIIILAVSTALALVGRTTTTGGGAASPSLSSLSTHTNPSSSTAALTSSGQTVTSSTGGTTSNGIYAVSSHLPLGLIVPLYMDPGPLWSQLIGVRDEFPQLQVTAVINPQGGVGTFNATYLDGIRLLQENGIAVFGYIDTVYTATPLSQVDANVTDYADWYNVTGVLIDDMTNTPQGVAYYASAYSYARAHGLQVIGNPGTATRPQYYGVTATNLMIYENDSLPSLEFLQNASMSYPAISFSFVATSVPVLPSQSYFLQASRFVSWVWVTDKQDSYMDLPTYLDQEMAELAGLPYSLA